MNGLGGCGIPAIPRPEAESGSDVYETFEIAREREPEESPKSVVVCEPYEAVEGSRPNDIAVPGLLPSPVLYESGELDNTSDDGTGNVIESRDKREKICLSISNLGKITVSRKAVRTILRTSRT